MSPHRLTSGERNSAGGCLDCGVSGTLEPGARNITHREGCAATWWLCLKGPQGLVPLACQVDPRGRGVAGNTKKRVLALLVGKDCKTCICLE